MLKIYPDADIKEFIGLPFKLYEGNPFFVRELKSDIKHLLTKDPVWQHAQRCLFIAKRGDKVIGRIAAIINKRHNEHWQDKTGFFGFFECEDNQEAASALIGAASAWLKARGCDKIRGPLNPSSNHTCGVLLDNFDKRATIMMPYNHPYYNALLESTGMAKTKDLLAFERTDKSDFSPRMKKIMERILKNPSIKSRRINMKNFDREVETVRDIYNASWAQNWGFVPITEPEMRNMAAQLKLILKPELTCIIEYDGKPAGFSVCVPDMAGVLNILGGSLNPLKIIPALLEWRKTRSCRMLMLGVHPDYRGKGLELLLVRGVVVNGIAKGWNKADLSWILEDNQPIIQTVEESGCYRTKSYRIYEKSL